MSYGILSNSLHSTLYIFVDAYIDSWTAGYMASKKTTNGNRLDVAKGNKVYRIDVGWHYGIDVDKNSRRVQCKYCQKKFSGGCV